MNVNSGQFNPLCEKSPMPGIVRSEVKSNNFRTGKMPGAPNLLRLNSVGEVSSEGFLGTRVVGGGGKLGFSKSLDSTCSPSKCFSAGRPRSTSNSAPFYNMMRTESLTKQASWPAGGSVCHGHASNSNFHPFASNPVKFLQAPTCQFGMLPKNNSSSPYYQARFSGIVYDRTPFFQGPNFNPKSMMNRPCSPRFQGFTPVDRFTAMSFSPPGAKKNSQTGSHVKGGAFQTPAPSNRQDSGSIVEASSINSQLRPDRSRSSFQVSPAPETDCQNALKGNIVKEACIDILGSDVDKLDISDSHDIDLDLILIKDNKEDMIVFPKDQDESSTNGNSSQKANGMKRRNEVCNPQGSNSSNCSLTSVLNDFPSVLFLRKTPKKGRPSCKKRKKKQLQRTMLSSEPIHCYAVSSDGKPSSPQFHSSPPKSPSSATSLSKVPFQASIKPLVSSPPKPRPSCVAKLFCSPDSDSEMSDDEEFDDCDSMKLSCDFSNSLSPSSELGMGPSLSLDSLFKPKGFSHLNTILNDSAQSSSSSPGSKKSLHFSFSFSVSEDDDSERSFESVTASPSEQLIFEFGNGLCLEAIIGRATEPGSSSSSPSKKSNNIEKPLSEQNVVLQKINAEWDKKYPVTPHLDDIDGSATNKGKVQFASDKDLAKVHYVGNEERRGTWYEDGQRFQKRIEDVGKALVHIFTDSHRQKVRENFGLI